MRRTRTPAAEVRVRRMITSSARVTDPRSGRMPRVVAGWLWLCAAMALEIVATSLMPTTRGFTRPVPVAACLLLYTASFVGLARALLVLQVGVAYAVWSGVGTAVVAVIGVALLGEPLTAGKVVGVVLIAAGVVALNLGGAGH